MSSTPLFWAASSLHDIFMTHGKDIAQRRETMFDPGYTEKVVNYCSGVAYTYDTDSFELDQLDANDNVIAMTTPTHVTVTGKAGPIVVIVAATFTLSAGVTLTVTGSIRY